MIKISEHLSLKEVTKSNTATRLGISNSPNEQHLDNLKLVAENIFEPIRNHFGVPIGISSGYRSPRLNKAIKGASSKSQHCNGKALDIDADIFGGLTNKEIFDYIKDNLDFDQLIWEYGDDENPAWVHVSFDQNNNRKKILKTLKGGGYAIY